jgi:amidase
MSHFIYKSAGELARQIRSGEATSTEIVQAHLHQIDRYNNRINAIVIIMREEAMAEAARCDAEAREGRFRGPLHGVPVTVKEQFWIRGTPSTVNSNRMKQFIAPEDAVVVDRLRKSGAIILGKTNVPKDLLDYQVRGDVYPEGKNPYNEDYSPGGSTGGGSAALAAGFTALELGGDFGGSIRVPSSFCGLYGLKPTERTVPLHGNAPVPLEDKTFLVHMAQAGPMARNLDDLEILWKILVGPDQSDRSVPRIAWLRETKSSLAEYKIAWTTAWPGYEASRPVSSAISSLIERLSARGAAVANDIPGGNLHEESLRLFVRMFPYVIALDAPWFVRPLIKRQIYKTLLKGGDKFRPEMNTSFRMDSKEYARILWTRSEVTSQWERFFLQYDFLICPVAFGPAYKRCKIGSRLSYDGRDLIYNDYVWPYVACFNASGHPAIQIPVGFSQERLPIGVQIVGPYWSEPQLIAFARQLSDLTSGFVRPGGYE